MGSVQLSDYLLVFPSACHHCGYRKFYTKKNYIGHRQTEYGETYDGIEEITYCARCGGEQESISERVYSPYLNEQESDAIPDFPYKAS